MALGALSYIRSHTDLRVAIDIPLIGFGDIQMASWPEFNLTALRNPFDITAQEILRLLDARIGEPEKSGETVMIDPVLTLRRTD